MVTGFPNESPSLATKSFMIKSYYHLTSATVQDIASNCQNRLFELFAPIVSNTGF
jgi:hypothetical protein